MMGDTPERQLLRRVREFDVDIVEVRTLTIKDPDPDRWPVVEAEDGHRYACFEVEINKTTGVVRFRGRRITRSGSWDRNRSAIWFRPSGLV